MGQSDFNAIGKARECDSQLTMICRQMVESFRAGSDDGGLQSSDGAVLESRDIGEIADHATGRGRQTRVGIDLHLEAFEFSGHGCWPETLRRLRGNRGNSRDRQSKGGHFAAPCRWCSTFHRRSDLPASRTARKRSDLPYGPLQKTLPEHGRLRQAEGAMDARVAHLVSDGKLSLRAGVFDPFENAC